MVKHAQLLLRDLDGRTRVLAFGRVPAVSCSDVVTAAASTCGLPRDAVRLVAGTAVLHSRLAPNQLLVAHDGALPACTLVLPLAGGKVRLPAPPATRALSPSLSTVLWC
jgi:hypothetical protein